MNRQQRSRIRTAAVGAAALMAIAGTTYADTSGSCSLQLGMDYPDAPAVVAPGERVRTRLTLGAGEVDGGTRVSVDGIRFFLGCNAASSLLSTHRVGVATDSSPQRG